MARRSRQLCDVGGTGAGRRPDPVSLRWIDGLRAADDRRERTVGELRELFGRFARG